MAKRWILIIRLISIRYNSTTLSLYLIYTIVIAVEPEGSRRDCNTMEKQWGRR